MKIKLKIQNKIRDKVVESNFTIIEPTQKDYELIEKEVQAADKFVLEVDNEKISNTSYSVSG